MNGSVKLRVEDANVEMQAILDQAAQIAARSDSHRWKDAAANIITEHPATPPGVWIYRGGHHIACIAEGPKNDCLGRIVEAE